ncbi:hypothetical protein LR69_03980 [Geobacillus sp. BCO2]|nr:hypothetical protein LR69_03980 [Geobacillus sp. BCO2]
MKGSREEERHETQRTEEIQRMDDRVFSPTEQVDRIAAGGPMKREALDWRGFPGGFDMSDASPWPFWSSFL